MASRRPAAVSQPTESSPHVLTAIVHDLSISSSAVAAGIKKAFRAVVLAKRLPRSSSAVSSFVRIYANSASDVAFLLRKSFVVKQSTIKLVASRPPRGAVQEQDVRPAAAHAGASRSAAAPGPGAHPHRGSGGDAVRCQCATAIRSCLQWLNLMLSCLEGGHRGAHPDPPAAAEAPSNAPTPAGILRPRAVRPATASTTAAEAATVTQRAAEATVNQDASTAPACAQSADADAGAASVSMELVAASCIATPHPSTSAAERAINDVLDAADGTDGAVTDAALDAVEALPLVARNTVANVLCSCAEGSMGFLNHDHFGKAAQEECSLSFRSVAQDCAVEHVCSKCKKAVHGNFISCARCGDLCSHCDRASATAESAGEPPGPPALLFHLVSTSKDPPSFAPRLRAFANAYKRQQAMVPPPVPPLSSLQRTPQDRPRIVPGPSTPVAGSKHKLTSPPS